MSDHALLLEFKGRINPYEHVHDLEKATQGWGRFTVDEGEASQFLDDNALAFEYTYGAEAPPGLAGKSYTVLQAFQSDPASTSGTLIYRLAQVAVPRAALAALHASGGKTLGPEDGVTATVRRITSVQRADGLTLSKDCTLTLLDSARPGSRLYFETAHNETFAVGENLFAWGNLALVGDPARLQALLGGKKELHQGEYCGCQAGQKPLACDLWEEEAQKSGFELSCPVPDGFLDPVAPDHAAFTFKGTIHAAGTTSPPPALASFTVEVNGTKHPMDYLAYAKRYTFPSGSWAGQEIVELTSLGDVQPLGKSRYRFKVLMTRVTVDLLQQLKAEDRHQPPAGEAMAYYAFLFDAEQILDETEDVLRLCPLAVSGWPPGNLHLCHAGNSTFAPSEALELAGNLALAGDAASIAELLGSTDCFCSRKGAAIPCSAFPEK